MILRGLLLQQLRSENDVIRLDFADIELQQNIIPIEKAEQLVGRPAVQLFAFVGVDMRKHQVNILLLEIIKASTLRQNAADKLVGDFDAALLIGCAGVAVEDKAAKLTILVLLNRDRVAEFAAAVSEDDWKQPTIGFAGKTTSSVTRNFLPSEHIHRKTCSQS